MIFARTAIVTTLAVAALAPAPAGSVHAETLPTRVVAPVRHGTDLDAHRVGPAALGGKLRERFPGGEIRDGRAYSFAKAVTAAAIYDGFRVGGPHLLIEGVAFTGPIDIHARQPVVMRGVAVRTEAAAPWAVHTRPEAGPVLFLWSEAGGAGRPGDGADRSPLQQRALYLRGDGAVIYRSHLSRAADGIQIHGRGARVIETLVDGLITWPGEHNDGIQMLGRGADLHILRSRIINANPQTSCLNLIGDRVTAADNYLAGGGWVIYGGANGNGKGPRTTRDVIVTGNVFGRVPFAKGGSFGPVAYWDATSGTGNVWSGNRFADGVAITAGAPPAGDGGAKR